MKQTQQQAIERRIYKFDVRASRSGDSSLKLTGYAAIFNVPTVLLPRDALYEGSPEVREVIEAGAFTKTLRESDVRAVWNHNSDFVLGRKSNRTLSLWEDSRGLRTEIFPPDTPLIRDMAIAPIERGDVDQMSFAFRIVKQAPPEKKRSGNEYWVLYRVKEVHLIEVSPVAIPAYQDTEISVSARSHIEIVKALSNLRGSRPISPQDDRLVRQLEVETMRIRIDDAIQGRQPTV